MKSIQVSPAVVSAIWSLAAPTDADENQILSRILANGAGLNGHVATQSPSFTTARRSNNHNGRLPSPGPSVVTSRDRRTYHAKLGARGMKFQFPWAKMQIGDSFDVVLPLRFHRKARIMSLQGSMLRRRTVYGEEHSLTITTDRALVTRTA